MIRMVIHNLFARLEFFPSTKTLITRIPIHEYRGIVIQKTYMDPKNGELVVEMSANSRETRLEEFNCRNC
jgi:hypothetical protein